MRVQSVICFVAMLMLLSCFKKTSSTITEKTYGESASNGVRVFESDYIDSDNNSADRDNPSWSSIISNVDDTGEIKNIDREIDSDEILFSINNFSSLETQHVSNKEHNPFGDKSYFILPLDEIKDRFCYPVNGKFLSNFGMRHGRMHSGVDIKGAPRDTIRAAFDGVVRLSKPYSGYGNVIVIRHFNGIETVYSHNSKNLVIVNQMVRGGEPIGLVGRTGRATTEHLHFEVRISGQAVDPNYFIDVHNQTLKSGELYISKKGERVYISTKVPRSADEYALAQETSIDPDASRVVEKSSAAKNSSSSSSQEAVQESSKGKVHIVKRGDTLSAIARRYGTTVNKLYSANGLNSRSVLQIGQKIKIK